MAQVGVTNRKRRLLTKWIFEMLEEAVLDGSLPPGTRLTEDNLAAQLGVSRTPVREAVKMLAQAGWVELQPHAGAHVRYPVIREAREVFEVREALEERAARLAAERATDEELSRLAKVLERAEKIVARESTDARDIAKLNSEFHRAVWLAAHNDLLTKVLTDLDKKVRWHFQEVATVRRVGSWTEHREILEALRARDADRAGELLVAHSRRTQSILLERLLAGESVHTSTSTYGGSRGPLGDENGS